MEEQVTEKELIFYSLVRKDSKFNYSQNIGGRWVECKKVYALLK